MTVETFVIDSKTGKASIPKDPNAILDYTFDWTDWLAAAATPADTIQSATFAIVGSAATISNSSSNTTKATAWVTGGAAGETIELRCRIVTAANRTDDRTVYLKVKER